MSRTRIHLTAPFAGWCLPLAQIPDAAFAEGMLGEGVGVDPLDCELRAPCDGEIISTAAARHAVALRSVEGAEILLHVGIDTVALNGEGFELAVRKGDRVRAGDVLLRFDLDALTRRAPSVVTPLIVTNADRFRIVVAHTGRAVSPGDSLLELEPVADAVAGATSAARAAPAVSEQLVVVHAHGIHARPAALLARAAKRLPYALEVRARGRGADPRSAVALMSLGIRGGDELVIVGFESAAAAGVRELAAIVRSLAPESAAPRSGPMPPLPASDDPGKRSGVIASRGLALGAGFHVHALDLEVAERGAGVSEERRLLDAARDRVRAELARRGERASGAARGIIEAHLELLDDSALLEAARSAIDSGKSAGFAWRHALRAAAASLLETGDARLAERAVDLADLERQVLAGLSGRAAERITAPAGSVLLARDLTPSQFLELEDAMPAGIALEGGGPTSHVAILCASRGVPMLVALGTGLAAAAGATVLLDAERGELRIGPEEYEQRAFAGRMAEQTQQRERARSAAQSAGRLASGERIEIFANLTGTEADARRAVEQGAEGCGLLRTEFLFLDRASAPDEAEQRRCYEAVARVLGDRPLIVRTFDVGGDKPIPYLPLPAEDNPALGLRGIRASLWRPDLFRVQLRALLATRPACRILLPMISDVEEVREVKALIAALAAELGVAIPPLGAMIETPAAAMLAVQIARETDFLSIGTNDLAQYALAMDRGHAELAARIDGLHPAVLRLIAAVTEGARAHGREVAVCGGLASDPAAVPLLVGLGVTELSAVPAMIPQLKFLVATLRLEQCRTLAERALTLESAAAVRALVAQSGSPS